MSLNAQHWGLLQLDALAERMHPRRQLPEHLKTGVRGEFEALFYLRQQGLQVVERRWRSPELNGDLDLIAWEGETLCFVEVKTRTERDQTPAIAAVDDHKRRMLARMGRAYLRTLPPADRAACRVRYDVVSVYLLGDGVECERLCNVFSEAEYQSVRNAI